MKSSALPVRAPFHVAEGILLCADITAQGHAKFWDLQGLDMSLDIDRLSQRIARSRHADGYKLWRTQKDLDTEIYQLESAKQPIPLELARMRAIIGRARAFRNSAAYRPLQEIHGPPAWRLMGGFDPYDFVDHYRALGGRREAAKVDGDIIIRAWNEDTREADAFWHQTMARLGNRLKREVATCLLERGRL
jgi:hypothetical protein